jgi:hypothetical protein
MKIQQPERERQKLNQAEPLLIWSFAHLGRKLGLRIQQSWRFSCPMVSDYNGQHDSQGRKIEGPNCLAEYFLALRTGA